MQAKVKVFSPADGYNLAVGDYDKKEKYLDSFEQGRLLPLFGDLTNKLVLDAGAGTGRLSLRLAARGAVVTALDISPAMLNILRKKNKNIRTVVGDVENMPYADASFDYIVATFVIVHLKNLTKFFDEAYRVLKDSGKLFVTNINQKEAPEIITARGRIKVASFYHRPKQVRNILEKLAFTVEKEIFLSASENWINQILVAKK